jgi:hypothetical protein
MDIEVDRAVGFLSYSHLDDEADEGRIRRLARKIQSEYRMITGQPLEIFVDRADLRWGENWKERIDGALQSTTFFIPVLSPSFFASDECRREFFEFYNTTRSLGVPRYLLAVRYSPVDDLVPGSSDQAKAIAAATQYKDWSELRLVDESGAVHRTAINDLALELQQLMREVQAQPAEDASGNVTPSYPSEHTDLVIRDTRSAAPSEAEPDDPYGDAISPIELVAELPERSAAWLDTMGELQDANNVINSKLKLGSADLTKANKLRNPFAAKLVVLKRVAEELDGPTRAVEQVGEKYMRALLELDPSFRAMAEIAKAHISVSDADRKALHTAQESVRSMVAAAQEATKQVRFAIDSGRNLARMSRDLRPALKRYEAGSQNIIDGQSIIEEWSSLLDSIELPSELPFIGDGQLEVS